MDPKSQDAFLEVPPTSIIEGSNCNPYKALALQGRHSSGHFSCTSSPNPLGSLGGWGGTVIPVLWRRKLRHRAVQGNSPKATQLRKNWDLNQGGPSLSSEACSWLIEKLSCVAGGKWLLGEEQVPFLPDSDSACREI